MTQTAAAPPVTPPDAHGEAPGQARAPRRRPPRRAVAALAVLTLIGLLAWSRWMPHPAEGALQAVGTLEATEITIAAEVSARVADVPVSEGQPVRADDVLVRLDDSVPQLQSRVAGPLDRQLLQLQLSKYTLRAPADGVVLRRAVQPGEVAVPGAPLLTLSEGNHLDLTLYVLQRDLGRVQLGQRVMLEAEALPGEAFAGEVASVSSKAEFTPRNAQTPKDRLNLVFAVKVQVDGADGRLKPGMTVTARFE